MDENKIKLTIGGLLHDIGKVLHRTGVNERHSKSGGDYLKKFDVDREILDCVKYHHYDEIKSAKLANNSLAYIVYIADNIASAVDRRDNENNAGGFQKDLPLASIFNLLNNNNGDAVYNPYLTNIETDINYPASGEDTPLFNTEAYNKILSNIGDNLKGIAWTANYVHSLLEVLDANLLFVPSSTSRKEVADISLYNHQKLTAAFAAAVYDYLYDKNIEDYRQTLFAEAKKFYEERAFLLVKLDLSGIQNFIYTIHSEGALKNLRARSFYLDFMTEHIASELLKSLGYTRANLLYSGGGGCDLIVANTENIKNSLQIFCDSVNKWFIKRFDIALFMAMGFAPCSSLNLQNKPEGSYAELYRTRAESIAESKAHRYNAADIIALNSRESTNDGRECKICGRSDNLNEDKHCQICAVLTNLGAALIKDEYGFIAVDDASGGEKLPLPKDKFLTLCDTKKAREYLEKGAVVYGKNKFYTGNNLEAKIWLADYHTGETFEKLANQSTGIKRLGIIRADIDNLGATFAFGFRRKGGDNRYVTLSRTAELSRQLSVFFKLHIKKILEHPDFTMTGIKKDKRHAAVVYSGGDDLFIVGAWDDVLELAVDIRQNFAKYSLNTLTISAGIGIYPSKYPISVMADETAEKEDEAKKYPGKNAVALPSDGYKYKIKSEDGKIIELDEGVYSWDDLIEKVAKEKIYSLNAFFGEFFNGDAEENEERGKNFLYNLLELLRNRKERINFARFIYLLSRTEPNKSASKEEKERHREFADKMIRWYGNDEDARQLKTAILLYVYLTRKE